MCVSRAVLAVSLVHCVSVVVHALRPATELRCRSALWLLLAGSGEPEQTPASERGKGRRALAPIVVSLQSRVPFLRCIRSVFRASCIHRAESSGGAPCPKPVLLAGARGAGTVGRENGRKGERGGRKQHERTMLPRSPVRPSLLCSLPFSLRQCDGDATEQVQSSVHVTAEYTLRAPRIYLWE